jgi:hypothetical protein
MVLLAYFLAAVQSRRSSRAATVRNVNSAKRIRR